MKKKIIKIALILVLIICFTLMLYISLKENIINIATNIDNIKAFEQQSNNNYTFSWGQYDSTNNTWSGTKEIQNSKNMINVKAAPQLYFAMGSPARGYIPEGTYCLSPGAPLQYQYGGILYNYAGTYSLPRSAAYIIADQAAGWDQKQIGIWKVRYQQRDPGLNFMLYEPGDMRDPAGFITNVYGQSSNENWCYYDTRMDTYMQFDYLVDTSGFPMSDNTNYKNVTVQVNNNTYKIGPFNISYYVRKGSGGDFSSDFVGIKNVTLMGLDGNKRHVQDIPIKTNNIPSDSNFYIEFELPSNTEIAYVQLKITFRYKEASGIYDKYVGFAANGNGMRMQDVMIPSASFQEYEEELKLDPVELLTSIGGNVWVDGLVAHGKDNKTDGLNNTTNDLKIPNVKVTLYTANGQLAQSRLGANESGISSDEIMHRVNPTYTDSNGNYLFKGLTPGDNYYVVFEYDGQMYLPTDKKTPEGTNTSKALEKANERTNLNNRFAEIRSYPENYQTSNSLGRNLGTYNKTYSQYDLMGYTLNENGKYQQTGTQLIDGYVYDANGNQTTTYKQGKISEAIQTYIKTYKKSPDIKTIYSQIAGNNTETWRMLQFVEDCKIKAYTNNFSTGYQYRENVNLGLWRRQETKLILTKDVLYGATRVNGKTEIYQYNNRDEASNQWEIQTRMQNYAQYYGGAYVNGIYDSDYTYEGQKTNGGNDLEVYITYKICIRNSSQNILTQIPEVVDYYDKNYELMSNLSWVMYDEVNLKQNDYYNMIDTLSLSKIPNSKNVNTSTNSRYGNSTHQDVTSKMNAIYIKGLQDKKLGPGDQAYIYLTFKVKENSNKIILDDYTNYAEINGYKTFYANGTTLPNNSKITNNTTVAGIIDQKSTPGNLTSADLNGTKYEKNFENDTDRAVGISVEIATKERNINGYVWEDERNNIVNGASIGDGIRKGNEKLISGITVQLVEKLSDGKEYLWKTTKTNKDGYYQFDGLVPGEYVIRFIYGNNTATVLTSKNGGENEVSYNGQDYKSTLYQKGATAGYDITIDSNGNNLSDAKDLWEDKIVTIKQANGATDQKVNLQGRLKVNEYSTTLTNEKSEILASPYANKINNDHINALTKATYMVAETDSIELEGEKNTKISIGKSQGIGNKTVVSNNGNYIINNIDFGLVERPKAQLELNKTVSHIKVLLANKNVLFDTKETTNNLIWQGASKYNLNSKMKDSKYPYTYRDNMLKELNRYEGNNNGIIQLTMDEEIMHGATIQISYKLGVKNVSEIDYTGKDFYYNGIVTSNSKLVTTTATKVIDYISNNLQYNQANNQGWTTVSATDVKKLVDEEIHDEVDKLNVILQTNIFAVDALEPGKGTKDDNEVELTLTQVITPENENDDYTYENLAEIVEVTNTVGRRMAFSIIGNQNPLLKAQEVDSSNAEQVIILPPFGNTTFYWGLGIAVVAILAGGIILIRKKVLK